MAGIRVFVSGVGGELGTQIAMLLEDEPWVGSLAGIDADPPRRRFRRTTFHRIHPDEHDKTVETVIDFDPHVLVHVGVWEPDSRAKPDLAAHLTDRAALSVLGAAAECRSLEHVIVRSGIQIYGAGPGSLTRPDETAPLLPTSAWGHTVAEIERTASSVAARVGVGVGAVRLASVIGPHVPSPLGRVLRLPAVPYNVVGDPSFAVIRQNDAARAIVAAASRRLDGPVNVVAPQSVTVRQAAHRGRRVAIPTFGPQWPVARRMCHLAGAPVPDHVAEILLHGRLADNGRMRELLGVVPEQTTPEVIDDLYGWPSVIRRPARKQVA
ncbi:NAD-dependent epimerase/dehydratase family protein [Ilumatobacter nonamiensis]|uniref:NAD-dependent epimerase/dehydratase family protein n=1 Tax=Ilumatobacter nonamiensis TaxID=467093 RepID=UPI000344B943|nr:NAD-dependent epimerase/dehydratase family protein [Ilumatobacter nonamiensis]